jgi:hypothetical protein
VKALVWEPEMELDEKALGDLDALLKENPDAKYFLWEGKPKSSHLETLQEKGLTSIIVSPCFSSPEEGDFLSVMKDSISNIKKATAQ